MKKCSIKSLHKKAWDLWSKIVRIKAIDPKTGFATCYTCHKQDDWKRMQAGHYRHGKLDFYIYNIKCQCVRCNKHLHGNSGAYAEHLLADYGPSIFERLDGAAALERGHKLTALEYEGLIRSFKTELERLEEGL